ncbi:DivIVA domain-containing protein [Naasia lichenicola]|uniref:DivIVA domain-containing protein n=1 Tax=Naasia lichenicola TaxID=2565933 RepID=A0A4S4FN79_9MICO|nr:DivIVA domain-containing protein [Naasia lichenicola]THG31718.1 DivIVA domain-containing protein [Naasia lichenicola]
MGTTFQHSRKSKLGYQPDDVDAFLKAARRAYDAPIGTADIDAEAIRRAAFAMEKGGYSTVQVDAALERLEDAFALREREHARRISGDKAWFGEARQSAQEILERLGRPDGRRFRREGPLRIGYDKHEVDEFCDRLEAFFSKGAKLGIEEVRTVAFTPKHGGYAEWQVDLLLDHVVDVMLAVR